MVSWAEARSVTTDFTSAIGLPYKTPGTPISFELAMKLSAVYRCVEVVSDAIASQSIQVEQLEQDSGNMIDYGHYLTYKLNMEPSPAMTRYTFMKTMVAKMLLEGNAYAIIHRLPSGRVDRVEIVNTPVSMYVRDDLTTYYEVGHKNHEVTVQGYNMIHLLNFTYNGLIGVSTLRHAANTLDLATSSENNAKSFFRAGGTLSGVLKSAQKLNKEKAQQIKDAWFEAFDVAPGEPSGVAVIEQGLDFIPARINPKDAQMLESREFNVVELCRFFGVAPAKVFDQKNLTYNNIESFQLAFLTDTVSPLNAKVETEFSRKLLSSIDKRHKKISLDINDLLKANMESKANYLSKMFQIGGYTVNEVRRQTKQPLSSDSHADIPMVQVNMQPLTKLNKEKNGKGDQSVNE